MLTETDKALLRSSDTVDLSGRQLKPQDLKDIVDILASRDKPLHKLNLSANNINDTKAALLANIKVNTLVLTDNAIKGTAVLSLLTNLFIEQIDLDRNLINDDNAKKIIEANKQVRKIITLDTNNLSSVLAIEFKRQIDEICKNWTMDKSTATDIQNKNRTPFARIYGITLENAATSGNDSLNQQRVEEFVNLISTVLETHPERCKFLARLINEKIPRLASAIVAEQKLDITLTN